MGTRSLSEVLERVDDDLRNGRDAAATTWPTGFRVLDDVLGGGLNAGDLTLVGGAQGLGKTTFALQIARNIASSGGHALYLCFEHREEDVLQRVLGMELGLHGGTDALSLTQLRDRFRPGREGGLVERLATCDSSVAALRSIADLGQRLRVVTVAGSRAELKDVHDLVVAETGRRPVVVVDYLQKLRVPGDPPDEGERVTQIVEGLKDMALELDLPVVAIVASDKSGLGGGRTRLHHLRGSTALAYEADVALLLNDKYEVVARHHLMYGTTNAEEYRSWVVCSIEKNRNGVAGVDLEFQKHFAHGRFDPHGRVVAESLSEARSGQE